MAIQIVGMNGIHVSPTGLFDGVRKYAASLRLRLDDPGDRPSWEYYIFNLGPFGSFFYNQPPADADDINLYLRIELETGTLGMQRKIPRGVPVAIAMVYDADDPSQQFISVNGLKLFFGSTSDLPVRPTSNRLNLGPYFGEGFTSSYTIDDAFVVVDAIPDDDELNMLVSGEAEAAEAALAARGGRTILWSLDGPEGSPVQEGDPGILSTGTEALALVERSSRGMGSYVDMPVLGAASRFGEPTVMSSGRVIEVPVFRHAGDDLIPANSLIHNQDREATFRINGGSPVAAQLVVGTDGNHDGLAFLLPEGVAVGPEDSVTWSAPLGLIATSAGTSEEVVDEPVRNRVGKTTYDPPEGTKPFRVGVNVTRPGASYYAPYYYTRNLRHGTTDEYSEETAHLYRPDGTRNTTIAVQILREVPTVSKLERGGFPIPLGLYYVSFHDKGAAGNNGEQPCEILLNGSTNRLVATEDVRYRNDIVLPDGTIQKVRVFEVKRDRRPVRLAGPIDATQTTIPLDAIHFGSSFPRDGNLDALLELDGETIVAGAVDKTANPPLLLECVRGVQGTAKAHEADAEGILGSVSVGGQIFSRINGGPPGTVHYSDLTILSPEDWEPPAEPGPAPYLAVAPDEFSREFLRHSAQGLGVMRFMDSTTGGTFGGDAHEVDQLPDLDAETWQRRFNAPRPKVVEVSQFDYEDQWVYFFHPGLNHETYPATLNAPLDAVPAGTRETISVSSDGAIMKGTRLLAGGERMRVISGSDSTFLVERGTDGTTPEAHAAGPIEAGWRVVLTPKAGGPADLHLKFRTDGPHGVHTFKRFVTSSNTTNKDCNPLARRNLTLTAEVGASDLTFEVEPADPGDWDYIHPGLSMLVGSETLLIDAADPIAGTVTVEKRDSGSAQPEGTAITTFSNRVLCESEDGTTRRWQPGLDYAYALRVTGPDEFLLARDGKGTEGRVIGVQTIDPPAVVNNDVPRASFPYELVAKFAAHSKGWLWLNISGFATDGHVREIARRVRDNFPPGRKVIVEMANEVWNWSFPWFTPFEEYARLIGLNSPLESWAVRSAHSAELVRSVFAEAGRGDEVLHCLPWQKGAVGSILKAARDVGVDVDATGCAPYINPRSSPEHDAAWDAADDGAACDLWAFVLARDNASGTTRRRLENDRAAVAEHAALTGRPLLMTHYEGGLDASLPRAAGSGSVNPDIADATARMRDIRNHPCFALAERDSYHLIQRHSGGDAIAIFNNAQGPWRDNDDKPQEACWGMNAYWGQLPGPGDGSLGGPDNRTNTFRGADLAAAPAKDKESVRWWAMLNYNEQFFAEEPGPEGPEEPDPDPEPKPSKPETPAGPFVGRSRSWSCAASTLKFCA